ncbi:MAG TPA: sensor histidine kinase [Ktedonobacteraceae bacterium]
MKHMQGSDAHEENGTGRARIRSSYLTWMIWAIWLPFMIPTIANLLQSHPPLAHLIIVLAGAALFVALYLWGTWQTARRLVAGTVPQGRVEVSIWLTTSVLAASSFALALSGPANQWLAPFIFTSAYAGGSLRTTQAILAVTVLVLLVALLHSLVNITWLELLQAEVFIVAVCFIIMNVVRAIKTSWELRAARKEIARLAVTAERLRIARDLHDLLGHNLSLITLKSELAGRLVRIAPERAAMEIGDIEQVARTTLCEVREAVASYRQPTLENELHAAQEILAAAGITYIYESDELHNTPLPTAAEGALAWAVREGVTNVIKHSRARRCIISLKRERAMVSIQVSNDGAPESTNDGTATHNTGKEGNGLRGLAERIEALGGRFDAGPIVDGGFCLAIVVPLKRSGRDEERRTEQ